jgi:hypothetical protein
LWDRDNDRGRAIPRRAPSDYPYPERYPTPYPNSGRYPSSDRYPDGRGGDGYQSVPFDNGYKDGYDKGREDARDNDSHDPVSHARYRAGDHGYDRRYGTREEYKNVYRDGFRAGYDEGYRDANVYGPDRRSGGILHFHGRRSGEPPGLFRAGSAGPWPNAWSRVTVPGVRCTNGDATARMCALRGPVGVSLGPRSSHLVRRQHDRGLPVARC